MYEKLSHPWIEQLAQRCALLMRGQWRRNRGPRDDDLKKLIDALPVLVAYVDNEERYRIVNKTYECWYKRPCQEVEGLTVLDMVGAARYARIAPYITSALQGSAVTFEVEFDYPDGKRRYVRPACIPDKLHDGTVVGIFVIIEDLTEIHQAVEALRRARDETEQIVIARTTELRIANASLQTEIAERKRTEQALAESEMRFRRMVDTAPVMIWLVSADRNQIEINRHAQAFLGRDLTDGPCDLDVWCSCIHPDDDAGCHQTFTNAFEQKATFEHEYRLRNGAGNYRWILERVVPRFTSEGVFLGFIGVGSDITERRQAEETRIHEAVAQRNLLVREVHHRIKNHLQGLIGLLERAERKCPAASAQFQEAATHTQIIATIHGLQAQSDNSQPQLSKMIAAIVETTRHLSTVPITLHCKSPNADGRVDETRSVAVALAVNELLLNAVKHGRFDPTYPGVEVIMQRTDDEFVIRVRNPGELGDQADKQLPLNTCTGLTLARLLLPGAGAELHLVETGPFVDASVTLTSPILQL